jgi:DNA polymerase III gamma/tau subunit
MAKTFGYDKMYRPGTWEEVLGNAAAVKQLQNELDDPQGQHVFLVTGPSGCGKTTLTRIAAKHLGCDNVMNLIEMNAVTNGGIDDVRVMERDVRTKPFGNRCWFIDEAHELTPKAQEAFLKLLEDGCPATDYFFFGTTDISKFKKTFMRRVTKIIVKPLNEMEITDLLEEVIDSEGLETADAVIEKIVELAEGSPAIALNLLQSISKLDETLALERLNDEGAVATMAADSKDMGTLIKSIFWPGGTVKESEIFALLGTMKKEETASPEGIRCKLVSTAANNILAGGKGSNCNLDVLDHLIDGSLFYNKSTAWGTLVLKISNILEPEED